MEEYIVRPAEPNDAESIYSLKRQAFGQRYLPYTIYKSPHSVSYIRTLITSGNECSNSRYIVATLENQVIGYYDAQHIQSDFFLNYIAVDSNTQHCGLGSYLLNHYEQSGRYHNCSHLALDVFCSNTGASSWYSRHGYITLASSFVIILSLRNWLTELSPDITSRVKIPISSLIEERTRGFSKAEFSWGSRSITIGLIADLACRLLAYSGMELEEALHFVADSCSNRNTIIVPALQDYPSTWQLIAVEQTNRMVKNIEG
jgi:ribosomal protein S18 acetylase RimI-like enzyme